MCGIAGFSSPGGVDANAARRATTMRDVLTHRGPDGAGLWLDGHAALAHRRLSIVDLHSGHQPMANERGTVWVVFNGEIYNHADVRHHLEGKGHQFRTQSDTEVIVHAYEEWGDDCVQRFRGMLAFALWDTQQRRLLLARDRVGVKPLYYAELPGGQTRAHGFRGTAHGGGGVMASSESFDLRELALRGRARTEMAA